MVFVNKSGGRHEKQPPPVVVLYVMFGVSLIIRKPPLPPLLSSC